MYPKFEVLLLPPSIVITGSRKIKPVFVYSVALAELKCKVKKAKRKKGSQNEIGEPI